MTVGRCGGVVLLVVAAVGCALGDGAGKNRCRTDDDCTSGRICRQGICSAPGAGDAAATPDVAGANDAPASNDAPVANDAPGADDTTPPADTPAAPDQGCVGMACPQPRCGNGAREGNEACDDGNENDGDFCTRQCRWTTPPVLASGVANNCLRTGDLRLVCWGRDHESDAATARPTTAIRVAIGEFHACAIVPGGALTCWGRPEDWDTQPPAGTYQDVASAPRRSCGVLADGSLACWGSKAPFAGPPAGKWKRIAVGAQHDCAIAADDRLQCWGRNDAGEATAPAGTFTQVAVGAEKSCALRGDGALVCWGAAAQVGAPGPFVALAVGGRYICAVGADARLSCWSPGGGELPAPEGAFSTVSAGDLHACALRHDGRVACWGGTSAWQTGLPRGPFLSVSTFTHGYPPPRGCAVTAANDLVCWGEAPPAELPAGKFAQVQLMGTEGEYGCALRTTGALACWGTSPNGAPPAGPFQALAFPCALRTDGGVVCWKGEAAPPDLFSQLVSEWRTVCGLKRDKTATCWLSEPATGEPAPQAPAGQFEKIAIWATAITGMTHVCGLRADGSLRCMACEQPELTRQTCAELPAAVLPAGPFADFGSVSKDLCGIKRADGRLACVRANPDGSGYKLVPPPTDEALVRLWGPCATDHRGALRCFGPWYHRSIDLDHP